MPRRRSAGIWTLLWLLGTSVCRTTASAEASGAALPAAALLRDDAASDVLVWEADTGGHTRSMPTRDDTASHQTDLLAWAATRTPQRATRNQPPSRQRACTDCFLVVGVKTRAVRGFEARQSIRATWGSQTTTLDVPTRIVFLACEPDASQEPDMNATQRALALETTVYGDLLTHELGGCVDGYDRLVEKVLGFFHWVDLHYPTAPFVMVADDDVYMRLDRVTTMLKQPATPREQYYAGQVLATQRRRAVSVIRDRTSKYYLSKEQYSMSTFPPFAIGAHYVLSNDVVAFLARNRHDLRGIGSLEDVSVGFWLLSLLQVHAVDIPQFRCTTRGLCRNAFASYGELSRASVQQIHSNLVHGDAFCHGFSFQSWSAPEILEPQFPKLAPRNDIAYQWEVRVCPRTRTLRVDTVLRVREPLEPFSLPSVPFTPSFETLTHFCDKLSDAAAQLHRRLPIMLCNDLDGRLHDLLRVHPLHKTALLALTKSNLHPIAVTSASVSVWITKRVIRWRAFIESLVAEIYPDVHVFVVDEITTPDTTVLVNLDLVLSANEYVQLDRLPPSCRRLVFTESSNPLYPRQMPSQGESHGAILFTLDKLTDALQPGPETHEHIYVPLVSLVFSDSTSHSPVELLQASSERSSDFLPVEMVATSHCSAHITELLAQLGEHQHINCDREPSDIDPDGIGVSVPQTVFAFDADVARYTRARFVLAFETHQVVPGYIAGTIAAAFLAGSIPVYDGDKATVAWLFNPKAFISCGRFASTKECGDRVKEVSRSPALYAEMRSESPVVNETAFFELFSWHPDVLRWSRINATKHESMVERLREKINRV